MDNREAIDLLKVLKELHIVDPELIDANDVCALERAIKALKIIDEFSNRVCSSCIMNEPKKGKCKDCRSYRQYGSRSDGYCHITRMTPEGETYINVDEDFYCSYFEDRRV